MSSPDEAAQRLLRLADQAAAQTGVLRSRAAELQRSLDLLSQELVKPVASAEAWVPPVVAPQIAVVEPPAPPTGRVPDDLGPARLIAIEMAISGSSRSEVGHRLTTDFSIADPAVILDDVFGAGSDELSRRPWRD